MTRIFFLLTTITILFSACSDEGSKNDSEVAHDGTVMQSSELDTCECNALDVDSLGVMYLKENLYTGICIQNYPETDSKYIEKSILDGKLHGKIIYYDKMGEVLIEELYENGEKKRSGDLENLTCDCKELERKEATIPNMPTTYYLDNIPFTGTCTDLYPGSTQTYMEVMYKNGLVEGRSSYYNRDGSLMYTEKYEQGKLVSTLH